MQKKITSDQQAFSTTMDAMFFLTLISIATVILLPSIMAERQYDSAEYTTKQDIATHTLSALLNSKADTFDYTVDQLSIVPEDPISTLINGSSTIASSHQQKHSTFAEIIAEDLAFSLYDSETNVQTNPSIMMQHKEETNNAISEFLDKSIGGRYNYHLYAIWEPVKDHSLKSAIVIGIEPPVDAIKKSSRISIPTKTRPVKDELLETLNDTTLIANMNATNNTKFQIFQNAFNVTIEIAAHGAANMIPPIPHYIDITNETVEHTEDEIIGSNQKNIEAFLKTTLAEEIELTAFKMANSTDVEQTRQLRDEQVDSIYEMVDHGYAEVTLSIW